MRLLHILRPSSRTAIVHLSWPGWFARVVDICTIDAEVPIAKQPKLSTLATVCLWQIMSQLLLAFLPSLYIQALECVQSLRLLAMDHRSQAGKVTIASSEVYYSSALPSQFSLRLS